MFKFGDEAADILLIVITLVLMNDVGLELIALSTASKTQGNDVMNLEYALSARGMLVYRLTPRYLGYFVQELLNLSVGT